MNQNSHPSNVVNTAVRRREVLAILWIASAVVLGSVAAASANDIHHDPTAADPTKVLGNATCVKCHAPEQAIWAATPHARTFDELHRRPEAAQIASKLGISSIKHGERCVACHYTQQTAAAATAGDTLTRVSLGVGSNGSSRHLELHSIAGVSCESCHGPARDWLDTHHDYGSQNSTRISESAEHRTARVARSIQLGMRNPQNLYLVAQSCYRCHTTGDEELVNIGGHSTGSLDFEFVSWSQGTVRHNFVRSDGKRNEASSPQRLRFMFVAGVIADTEASLRAVATATVKDKYAITVAKRAARAVARLRSVAEKVDDARLHNAVAIVESIQIKLNNAAELEAAANQLSTIGYDLAKHESDSHESELHQKLVVLDRFIPDPKTWK